MEQPVKSASPQPVLSQALMNKSQDNQQTNNPIARKLNKILESRIENDKVTFCFVKAKL